MLVEFDFAKDLLEKIELELSTCESNQGIEVITNHPKPKISDIDKLFKSQNYCLPFFTRESTELIQISNYFYEIYFAGIKNLKTEFTTKESKLSISELLSKNRPASLIYTAIYDKVNNLIFNYREVLEATKNEDNFIGILDEERLLINHLNKYYKLLNSTNKQVEFLRGIIINQKISTLILKIYIRFIELRLEMINPSLPKSSLKLDSDHIKIEKLVWLGSQRQLCELIVSLQNKGWIKELRYGKINKTARAICNLFDLTLTQKNTNTDIENSFYQILKGKNNRESKKREYDEVFGDNYEFVFKQIKKNEG